MTPTRTRIISDPAEFARLREPWDALVRSAREPCAVLLHGWLSERIRFYGDSREPAVIVAERDGALVGGLPLAIHRRLGARAAELLPGDSVSHCDLLARDAAAARAVLGTLVTLPADFVIVGGVVPESHLATAPGLRFMERERAPYVEMPEGWERAYQTRFSGHRRREHGRARRRLAEHGEVAFETVRDPDGIEAALRDAFALHDARFGDALDRSEFREPEHRGFHVAKGRALAAGNVARLATVRVDGELAAFG